MARKASQLHSDFKTLFEYLAHLTAIYWAARILEKKISNNEGFAKITRRAIFVELNLGFLLGVAALFDPKETKRKKRGKEEVCENFSLEYLVPNYTQNLLTDEKRLVKTLKKVRHKYLAHKDRQVVRNLKNFLGANEIEKSLMWGLMTRIVTEASIAAEDAGFEYDSDYIRKMILMDMRKVVEEEASKLFA